MSQTYKPKTKVSKPDKKVTNTTIGKNRKKKLDMDEIIGTIEGKPAKGP